MTLSKMRNTYHIAIVSLLLTMPAAAQDKAADRAERQFSRASDAVVIEYTTVLGELAHVDRGRTVQVFGDGRVVTHFPVYMKRAGDYESYLAESELEELVDSMVDLGVADFDEEQTKIECRQADQAKLARARSGEAVELFHISDPDLTEITVNLSRYRPAGQQRSAARALQRKVAWPGLRHHAKRYPGVKALADLREAESRLEALIDRPGARKVD